MTMSELIAEVSSLSRATHGYYERELPRWFPKYPFVQEGETEGPPPPEEARLRDLLDGLPDETLYALSTIERIGQHGLPADDPEAGYEQNRKAMEPRLASFRLLRNQYLAEELAEGVARLKAAGFDVDSLPLPLAVG